MLVVVIAPHGLMTTRVREATLFQALRTVRLLRPHGLVGHRWQNTGLHPGSSSHNKYVRDFVSQAPGDSFRHSGPRRPEGRTPQHVLLPDLPALAYAGISNDDYN